MSTKRELLELVAFLETENRTLVRWSTQFEAERDAARQEVRVLRFAARGGTATRDTAELLTFMADRFVTEHGEDEATDWVRAAYERARMLRNALGPYRKEEEQCS